MNKINKNSNLHRNQLHFTGSGARVELDMGIIVWKSKI